MRTFQSIAYPTLNKSSSIKWQPETIIQKNRIEVDGGTIINLPWMNRVITTLKALDIYSSTKLLTDANFGVKKDGSGAVSKLYDISGNNNDAVQATGASQPIWSLSVGKGVITYDGVNDYLSIPLLGALTKISIFERINADSSISTFKRIATISGGGYIATNSATSFNLYLITSSGSVNPVVGGFAKSINQQIGVTWDGSTVKWYLNDGIISSSSLGGIIASTTSTISNSTFSFKGQINSSTIFNIALTQSQITQLTNLGL